MRRANKSFDFARSPEGVILSTVEGRSTKLGLDKRGRISYEGRSAKSKTPNVLRQAQDDLRQSFGETDLDKRERISYETGRMPVETNKQDAYATGQAQGMFLQSYGGF